MKETIQNKPSPFRVKSRLFYILPLILPFLFMFTGCGASVVTQKTVATWRGNIISQRGSAKNIDSENRLLEK